MWHAGLLKRFGDLLDAADDKASTSDLQTLTKEVAGGALEAANLATKAACEGTFDQVKRLDLGLVDGWQELKSQIGSDLKGLGSKLPGKDKSCALTAAVLPLAGRIATSREPLFMDIPDGTAPSLPSLQHPPSRTHRTSASDRKTLQRLADLREHVRELEAREAEMAQARDRAQRHFEEISAETQKLQGEPESEAESSSNCSENAGVDTINNKDEEHELRMQSMRREFYEHQVSADTHRAALEAELSEVRDIWEKFTVELDFWREKTQGMLAACGLDGIPDELRVKAERGDSGQHGTTNDHGGLSNAATMPWLHRTGHDKCSPVRTTHERLVSELAEQQLLYEGLESRLSELMRGSDVAVSLAEGQRRRERELQSGLAAAEATAAAEAAVADAASQRLCAAEFTRAAAQQDRERQELEESRMACGSGSAELMELRHKAEMLRRNSEELAKENTVLEGRLQRYRAAAAADLERAVPLTAASCWQGVDGPSLKLATLLVKSGCLRRTFAAHLVATYVWLFFLIFWLEKH